MKVYQIFHCDDGVDIRHILRNKKIKGEGGLGAEDFLPAPLLEGFTTLKDSINDTKETLVSFAKPITGAIKLFKQRAEIMEKLRKFSIKELALKTKVDHDMNPGEDMVEYSFENIVRVSSSLR